jgi:hypothetical protein
MKSREQYFSTMPASTVLPKPTSSASSTPLGQRRAQGKNRGLNLVGVEVHAGVEQRLAQAFQPTPSVLQREVMRDVFGLVGREQGRSGRGRGIESKTDSHRNGFSNLNWLKTLFRMYFLQALCRRKRRVPTGFLWRGVAIFAVTLRVFAGAQAGDNENHCGG